MAFSIEKNDSTDFEVCISKDFEDTFVIFVEVTSLEGMKYTFYTKGFKVKTKCVEDK